MLTIKKITKNVSEVKFTPAVIEPSFGVGRIIQAIFEHSYYQREEDKSRGVMKFLPVVAPVKCALFPLSGGDSGPFSERVQQVRSELSMMNVSCRVDVLHASAASIGKRYARSDEIGIPFGVTVDFETIKEESELFNTVTLRERDSTHQMRISIDELPEIIARLSSGRLVWSEAYAKYPKVAVSEGK
eukprot:GSMAST32.ASY1.ANO1.1810.1 assembled CDS